MGERRGEKLREGEEREGMGRRGEEWAGERRSGRERGGVGRRGEEGRGERRRGEHKMLTTFYCISVCVGGVLYSHETCVFTTTLQLPSSADRISL